MGAIVHIQPALSVDEAWARYQVLAQQLQDDPKLLTDRGHHESMRRAYNEFLRLFDAEEAAR